MEVKFLNQPKEVKLGEMLKNRLNGGFKGVYFIAGMVKDTGFEELLEALENARNNEAEVNLFVGIDRKNTSKDMLLKLIDMGCKLNVHINTDASKVETRAFLFEAEADVSYIYITSAKFSAGGLLENACVVTEIKYLPEEKQAFDLAKNIILQGAIAEFHEVDRDEIILLAEKGEIVARITQRKIPKINEMYGSSEPTIGEKVYDESTSSVNLKLEDFADVDIDFDDGIGIRKNVELISEKEAKKEQEEKEKLLKSLKKTESDLERLYKKKDEDIAEKKKPTIHMSTNLDYENMTTLMIEANKIIESGAGAGEVKIPKMVADNTLHFFGGMNAFEITVDDKKSAKNMATATFKVLDNKDNKEITDSDVKLILTDKGISIKSSVLIDMKLVEGDIVRIIKEEEKVYKCEVIRLDTAEYNVWTGYLLNSIRGQKRKFGIL